MDREQTRERLRQLGADRLVDALLTLADSSDVVRDTIQRMTAAKSESIARYHAKLTTLATANRFITGQGVHAFCGELERMLLDLQAGVDDPDTGFDLITAFFEADKVIFEQCDDSSGSVGDVFRYAAADLLVHYGAGCTDQSRIVARLVQLYGEDEYGIRDVVIDAAHRFLPTSSLHALTEQLWERAQHTGRNSYAARHWLLGVASVARQLRDAPLFEQAQRAMHDDLPATVHLTIAEAYLDAGDALTARTWLERIPENPYHAVNRDALLLKVSQQLGDTDTARQVAWRMYETYHSEESLRALLAVIGEAQRDQVIAQTAATILDGDQFSASDALFLTSVGRTADAATYILAHTAQLNGDYYSTLLPLAESMEKEERWLAATVIYRALTDSILKRAVSKYYHHGVRYLRKLDSLAPMVTEWQGQADHAAYLQRLRQDHGRKTSFWSQYAG